MLLTALWGLGVAAVAGQVEAKLTRVEGQVWLTPPAATASRAAHQGDAVSFGERIRTAAEGAADVSFADGSVVQVRGNTEMELSRSRRQVKKSALLLFFGTLWTKIVRGEQNAYDIRTPNAVCGVRGTAFVTAVADDGTLRVHVDEGEVSVEAQGTASAVGPGQTVEADLKHVEKSDDGDLTAWAKTRREALPRKATGIMDHARDRVAEHHRRLNSLRAEQKGVDSQLRAALAAGDAEAAASLQVRLAQLADAMADAGDAVSCQVGLATHLADLAKDARFAAIDRKTLAAEANNLRHVKATLDKLVTEGTSISMQAMDEMLQHMRDKHDTLRDERGSARDLLGGHGEDELR